MRKILILPVLVLLLYSCNDCRNLDCLSNNYTAYFRLLQQPGDIDLVFGPSAIYKKDSIRFYVLSGSDTVYFPYQPVKLPGTDSDSMLSVTMPPDATLKVYMQLDNQDTDTFQVRFKRFDTKCCGTITQIDSIRYNNQSTVSATEGILEFSK